MIGQFHFGYIYKRIDNRYLYTHVHSSMIHKNQRGKQPKRPLTDEWINKMWHMHTMEYYSALKSNEILTHATVWMNFKDILLSEINQSQRNNFYVIPLTLVTKSKL